MYRFKESKIFKIILLCFIFLFVGCPSTLKTLKPKIKYKRNLKFKINKETFIGVGVPSYNKSYLVTIEAPFPLDFVKIETCHRETIIQNAFYKKRIMKNKKKYQFTYNPIGIERDCILIISILSKKGIYHFGQAAFQTKGYGVMADNYCNGSLSRKEGVSMCQSKKGLIQLIEFESEMKPRSNCPVMALEGNKKFRYEVGKGDCVFLFLGKDRIHKLITYGYEEVILEE